MDSPARQIIATNPVGDEFDRLKSLLFRSEAKRLGEFETALGALDHRVGTPDRLVIATTEVLVDALRRAEVAQHRELAQALAPVVVACIRNEIKNSKDMMVEALYPITGRLVSAGIAVAMAELAAAINARMDSLLSVDMLKLRFQAWRSGRPLSELALLQAQRGRLVRLLYLERGSGQLLGQWQADHGEDERADLISGMIAALTDFARNALGPGGGELRTLDLGGRKIYLRSSSQMIVAAEFMGNLVPKQERQLNDAFLALLEASNAGDTPEDALASLGQRLAEPQAEPTKAKSRFSPLLVVALLLGALLAWFAFQSFRHWRHETLISAALQEVIAARPDLAAYPLKIETQHGARQVRLSGLVPSAQDGAELEKALQAAASPYAFAASLAVIGTQRGLDAADATVQALGQKLAADNALLRMELSGRIGQESAVVSDRMAQLDREAGEARRLAIAESAAALGDLRQQLATERAQANASLAENLARIDAGAAALQARLSAETAAAVLASGHQTAADIATAQSALGQQLARIEAESAASLAELRQQLATERAQANASLAENLARIDAGAAALQARLSAETAAAVLASGHQTAADIAMAQSALGQQLARIEAEKAALQTRLAAEISATRTGLSAKVETEVSAVTGRVAQAEANASDLQTRLALETTATRTALAGQIQTEIAAVTDRLAALGGDLDAARKTLAQDNAASLGAAQAAIAAVNRRLDTPRARLDEELRGFAVFFLADDVMVDETQVRDRLNSIAKLAMAAGGIRVVGYSDETGTPARNRALSRLRAQIVVQRLVDAGMDRARIVVASRTVQIPLADPGDPTNQRNRRVTLEPLYDNEIAP